MSVRKGQDTSFEGLSSTSRPQRDRASSELAPLLRSGDEQEIRIVLQAIFDHVLPVVLGELKQRDRLDERYAWPRADGQKNAFDGLALKIRDRILRARNTYDPACGSLGAWVFWHAKAVVAAADEARARGDAVAVVPEPGGS